MGGLPRDHGRAKRCPPMPSTSTFRATLHASTLRELEHHSAFLERHIGPNDAEIAHMLRAIGHD